MAVTTGSFGKDAVAFCQKGWNYTIVVKPPKGGFGRWSLNNPGCMYLNDSSMKTDVFRTLRIVECTGNYRCMTLVFKDFCKDGSVKEGNVEIVSNPPCAPHGSLNGWTSLTLLENVPHAEEIVPLPTLSTAR